MKDKKKPPQFEKFLLNSQLLTKKKSVKHPSDKLLKEFRKIFNGNFGD